MVAGGTTELITSTAARLQDAADRHDRQIGAPSNLLKKIADTQDNLTQNLK
jgi:hypothetical protein